MHQVRVVLLCILPTIHAGLLDTLTSDEKGLQLGNGVSLHLDRVIKANGSLLETHALRLDYSRMGLSVGKALKSDAIQLKLFITDEVEGRKRKVGDIMVPALVGFKMAAIAAAVFTAVTLLVLKSVALGNLSIAVALGIFLSNYFRKKSESKEESIYYADPTYDSYPSATGYNSAVTNFISNTGYHTIQGAESKGQYSIAEPLSGQNATDIKRYDFFKSKQ